MHLLHTGAKEASKSWGARASRGTFRLKRAPKNFFPEMLATGFVDVISKKFSGHAKIFSGHITFFPENDKNFPDVLKKFSGDHIFSRQSQNFSGHIKILPENNRIFQEIPKYKNKSNHKSKAIGQKMQSKVHFSRR